MSDRWSSFPFQSSQYEDTTRDDKRFLSHHHVSCRVIVLFVRFGDVYEASSILFEKGREREMHRNTSRCDYWRKCGSVLSLLLWSSQYLPLSIRCSEWITEHRSFEKNHFFKISDVHSKYTKTTSDERKMMSQDEENSLKRGSPEV